MKISLDLEGSIQRSGRFLSGMIMPNIGAFIAWGLLTAMFIPDGWIPNAKLATLVDPMLHYMIPILIGYSGGRMVYGRRGGVIGVVATMGAIVGSDIPMLTGAMIMGPVAGYIIKKVDERLDDITPSGFEMLVHNFSAGIIGGSLSILAVLTLGPVIEYMNDLMVGMVEVIVANRLLPMAAMIIEPIKVLFLNNAVNHGVLAPLGVEQVAKTGKSVIFLLETNPGPGLGILMAYFVFSKGKVKQSVPGAMIIHFFGGIHEIYFPYILMQPRLILAAIAGSASGIFVFEISDAGLLATPSPGSIVAIMALTARDSWLGTISGILVSVVVSFLTASVLIDKRISHEGLEDAKLTSSVIKSQGGDYIPNLDLSKVRSIVVACDAGMGSSAVGAGKLEEAINKEGLAVKVANYSIDEIPMDTDLVVTHYKLSKRAHKQLPSAVIVSLQDFITTEIYEILTLKIKDDYQNSKESYQKDMHLYHNNINHIHKPIKTIDDRIESQQAVKGLTSRKTIRKVDDDMGLFRSKKVETLTRDNIILGLASVEKVEAIKMAGQILVDGGYVEEAYIDAMIQRDSELSTFIGNGTAIPHGVSDAKKNIINTGISVLQFPDGVDFDGNLVHLVVGIAGKGNEHLTILANLAEIVEDEEQVEEIRKTNDVDYIYKLFTN